MAPAGDEPGDHVVGLLGRPALAVDGRGGDLVGQARAEPRGAGDVGGLLARLGDAAADDLLDLGRPMPARSTTSTWVGAEQLGGMQSRQPPLRLPIGVRTASTITGCVILIPLDVVLARFRCVSGPDKYRVSNSFTPESRTTLASGLPGPARRVGSGFGSIGVGY